MASTIRTMRLSILAALGLSSFSAFAQEGPNQSAIPACNNPTPIVSELVRGSGYIRCEDGRILREEAIWDLPGNPGPACGSQPVDTGFSQCKTDAECNSRPYGHCIIDWGSSRGGSCACEYLCMSDLDCRIGQVCLANGISGSQKRCVDALNCRKNADCESGQCEVSEDYSLSLGGGITLGCRSERDECKSHADCQDGPGCGFCLLDPDARRWRCVEECFAIGRPFLVHGEATLPALVDGDEWIEAVSMPSVNLDSDQARCAAAHWIECARMEHASVAAFARFALQLMQLGAPPELLELTTNAMQDEIAHAKSCFALAKRYGGQAQSAGPLEVSQALEHELEPARIAVDVFLEGCVGESIAALEASEMSRLATDPQVRAVLSKVAQDEHEHALLAWRSLAWMLKSLSSQESAAIRSTLTQLMAQLEQELEQSAQALSAEPDELELHGVASSKRKRVLRRQAIASLVLPCANALLSAGRQDELVQGRASVRSFETNRIAGA